LIAEAGGDYLRHSKSGLSLEKFVHIWSAWLVTAIHKTFKRKTANVSKREKAQKA